MLLQDVVATWRDTAAAPGRSAKVARLAQLLSRLDPPAAAVVVPWLSGELRQRRTGIGGAALRDAPAPAETQTLTVAEVDDAFSTAERLAGPGSAGRRRDLVAALFARATAPEQAFLRGLVSGELRQGAQESLVVDAVAAATRLPPATVRRAVMLCGSAATVAELALRDGAAGLAAVRLRLGQPVQPMLASSAPSVEAALERLGGDPVAVEAKLDGIRVQLHRDGGEVAVFTRSLDDVTARVPELVELMLRLPEPAYILDGEAIALRPDGRPRPFQETGARAARQGASPAVPLSLFAFDVLHAAGSDVLDLPAAQRHEVLASVVPTDVLVPRVVTASPAQAAAFSASTVAGGHEGVVVKSLAAAYEAGRRGSSWVKVKPVHTLDLVVLAAEWGHGRRRGWLSNLHLGAREEASGQLVMLGKTFKGLTDEMLRWQTERLLALEVERNDWQVFVRPSLVVEVAFDGVQTSPRYPGGVALRFARVLRYREDKRPEDADTLAAVRALLPPPD